MNLLKRYPKSEYEPEVLYLLYLISNDLQEKTGEKYKERLLSEYPNSTYSKTIINPNYKQESEAISAELKKMYASAYSLFEGGDFKASDSVLNIALKNYAANDFTDNLTLLHILIIGKTEKVTNYQIALKQFIEKYPDSDLKAYAQKLLEASTKFEPLQSDNSSANSYLEDFDQEHMFVVVFDKGLGLAEALPPRLDTLNQESFKNLSLQAGNMSLTDNKGMIMVNEFKNKKEALGYMNQFNHKNDLKSEFPPDMVQEFVISKDNFQILYKTKDINSYVSFFEKHY